MNREWSDQIKEIQKCIEKEATFAEGIEKLLALRHTLFGEIERMVQSYHSEAFALQPFLNANGYHSKTLAYSIWHIFRIEDIVAHELILRDEQVLFAGNYREKIGADRITTGNELKGTEIAEFSKLLQLQPLCEYAKAVMERSDEMLKALTFADRKRTFTEDKQALLEGGCVSHDADAVWLIDYWCGKNLNGLLRMPFSRHWVQHTEAMLRIADKLSRQPALLNPE